MNNEREELARTLSAAYGSQDWMIAPVDRKAAEALMDAGYRIPKILGYAVVDQKNTPLMVNFPTRKDAEEYALENSERMNRAFRVAEIVEPPRMMARLRSWWRRNVIDTDPNPQYSRLDRMDGLR